MDGVVITLGKCDEGKAILIKLNVSVHLFLTSILSVASQIVIFFHH